MGEGEKWHSGKSIKYLPRAVRSYFTEEARSMYHALASAEIQIVEDKSGTKRPGRYGERIFRVVSTNPTWYHELYFSKKGQRRRLTKKQKAAIESAKIRKEIALSEREGVVIDARKKRKAKRDSLKIRVKTGLDAIIRGRDITLPDNPRNTQPGTLQARLRELIFERLMNGYNDDIDGSVPPLEDMEFLRYFDVQVEDGVYDTRYGQNSPDDVSPEFAERTDSEDFVPF